MWDADPAPLTDAKTTRRLDWNDGTAAHHCDNPILLLNSAKGAVVFEKTTTANNLYAATFAGSTWTATNGVKVDGGGMTLAAIGGVFPQGVIMSDEKLIVTYSTNPLLTTGGLLCAVTGTWSGSGAASSVIWSTQGGILPVQIQGAFSLKAYWPFIATSGTNAFVTFIQDEGVGAAGSIRQRLYVAKYNGTSWAVPTSSDAVDAGLGNIKGMPWVSMDASGKAYAAMLQDIGTGLLNRVYYNFYY
jgi:hypothetical protein